MLSFFLLSNLSSDLALLTSDMRHFSTIILSIFLLAGLLFSSCEHLGCDCYCSEYDAEDQVLNDTIDLKYGQLYCNSEQELRLSFDSISDSRCPIGAICVWEGNASVRLLIKQGGDEDITFRLNTHGMYMTDTLVNGLRYELIDLLPYPEIEQENQAEDFILQLLISD